MEKIDIIYCNKNKNIEKNKKNKNIGMETTTINKWHSKNAICIFGRVNFPEVKMYTDMLSGEMMDKLN